eukprot:12863.XXX_919530_919775_1 [CDS] Oithona nana genome sequencing.
MFARKLGVHVNSFLMPFQIISIGKTLSTSFTSLFRYNFVMVFFNMVHNSFDALSNKVTLGTLGFALWSLETMLFGIMQVFM